LPTFNCLLTVLAIALTTFIFVRDRENIQRLNNGTDGRLSLGLRAKKKRKRQRTKKEHSLNQNNTQIKY
ncbi:hypothetical protein ACQ1ZP_14570, partial [Enterococcus faecalis]